MLYLGIFYAQAPARPFLRVTTPLKGDRENRGSQSRLLGSIQQLTASDRMLRGRSPQGLKRAVYLLIRSFIRSFINIRSLMLSIGGQGMLSNTIHLCWIVQVPQIGEQCSSCHTIEGQQQWFSRSHHLKTFHHRP